MSDQTPPENQPTPPPAESAGVPAGEAAAPPPPPPASEAPLGEPAPPPPPPKKSRVGLIIGIIAGVLVLAVVAALLVVFVFNKDDKHTIVIPATAADMKRDKARETSLKTQLTQLEQQFKKQLKGAVYVKSGIYDQADTKRGPKGEMLFLGGKVKKSENNPTNFVDKIKKQGKDNGYTVTTVSPGKGGGKAVCVSQSKGNQKAAICGWATQDTVGELVPNVSGYDPKSLSKIMRDLRPDVEKTQ